MANGAEDPVEDKSQAGGSGRTQGLQGEPCFLQTVRPRVLQSVAVDGLTPLPDGRSLPCVFCGSVCLALDAGSSLRGPCSLGTWLHPEVMTFVENATLPCPCQL